MTSGFLLLETGSLGRWNEMRMATVGWEKGADRNTVGVSRPVWNGAVMLRRGRVEATKSFSSPTPKMGRLIITAPRAEGASYDVDKWAPLHR